MSELAQVRRAASERRRAELVFRAALLAAVDAGCSYAELARTVGVSRQAARQLVERAEAGRTVGTSRQPRI